MWRTPTENTLSTMTLRISNNSALVANVSASRLFVCAVSHADTRLSSAVRTASSARDAPKYARLKRSTAKRTRTVGSSLVTAVFLPATLGALSALDFKIGSGCAD